MRPTTALFFAFAAVAATTPLAQSPPQAHGIQFVCTDFPDVCANMCWAAYCVPSSTTSLVYDNASRSKRAERRRAAGCIDAQKPGTNRCSKGRPGAIPGYNCDEFPFASAKSASGGRENRCSRCVPSKENCKQGAALAKGYRKFCHGIAPCNFQVFFGNPGAAAHCGVGAPGQCNPNPAETCTGSINIIAGRRNEYAVTLAERDGYMNGTFVPGPVQFRTALGQLLDAPYGGTIGQAVHRPRAVNETLHDELLAREECGEEGDNDDVFDELVDNMGSEVDFILEVTWEARLKE